MYTIHKSYIYFISLNQFSAIEKGVIEMALTLTKERRGEIAEMLFKQAMIEEGIKLQPEETKRNIGNWAKKTGLSKEEIVLFLRPIAEEVLKKVFSEDKK